jgi:ABC-type sugar transport system substrate-binding protein
VIEYKNRTKGDEMNKKKRVTLLAPVAGVVLSMSAASAQTIFWAPASTSVPFVKERGQVIMIT